jgi:hypothetical protein
MGTMNRLGKWLSYGPPGYIQEAGGIHSLESIPGLHKRLKIRALSASKQTCKESDVYLTSNLTGNNFYYDVIEN